MALAWLLAGLTASAGLVAAQEPSDEEWCDRRWGDREYEWVCEVRVSELPATGEGVDVDAGRNGGISVEGWDRDRIEIRARVVARSRSLERADELAGQVRVITDGGRIRAEGPPRTERDRWSVSYRIRVPRDTDLGLEANNGGIGLEGVRGRVRFSTRNGGVRLADLAGDVRGATRNGGLHVVLDGRRWNGPGLDVETRNGGVTLLIPEGYSAELEAGTTNGGIDLGFPVTFQGRVGRGPFQATLGEGGSPVRVVTTNGGVRIDRR